MKLKRTACHVTPFAFAKDRATTVCRLTWCYAPAIAALLISIPSFAGEHDWMQGAWICDGIATIQTSSIYRQIERDSEDYDALAEMLEREKWEVREDRIIVRVADQILSYNYQIKTLPTGDNNLELDDGERFRIVRKPYGFCLVPDGDDKPVKVTCLKRGGA